MNKNLGLLLVVVGVVLIGVTVLFMTPKNNTEQKLVEAKLNEEQMQQFKNANLAEFENEILKQKVFKFVVTNL